MLRLRSKIRRHVNREKEFRRRGRQIPPSVDTYYFYLQDELLIALGWDQEVVRSTSIVDYSAGPPPTPDYSALLAGRPPRSAPAPPQATPSAPAAAASSSSASAPATTSAEPYFDYEIFRDGQWWPIVDPDERG